MVNWTLSSHCRAAVEDKRSFPSPPRMHGGELAAIRGVYIVTSLMVFADVPEGNTEG